MLCLFYSLCCLYCSPTVVSWRNCLFFLGHHWWTGVFPSGCLFPSHTIIARPTVDRCVWCDCPLYPPWLRPPPWEAAPSTPTPPWPSRGHGVCSSWEGAAGFRFTSVSHCFQAWALWAAFPPTGVSALVPGLLPTLGAHRPASWALFVSLLQFCVLNCCTHFPFSALGQSCGRAGLVWWPRVPLL